MKIFKLITFAIIILLFFVAVAYASAYYYNYKGYLEFQYIVDVDGEKYFLKGERISNLKTIKPYDDVYKIKYERIFEID